jgi:hypothetical protein
MVSGASWRLPLSGNATRVGTVNVTGSRDDTFTSKR